MIVGAHSIIYSRKPEADRAFLREVIGLPGVDVGGGWLIFGLPPAEVAVHPSEDNDVHEFFLMCAEVEEFVRVMKERGVACAPVQRLRWGLMTRVSLPGGGRLGVYEPLHPRPRPMSVATAGKAPASRARPKKTRPRAHAKPRARRARQTR